jgi:hypothetical protein
MNQTVTSLVADASSGHCRAAIYDAGYEAPDAVEGVQR